MGSRVELFKGIDKDALRDFLERGGAVKKRVDAGEYIFREQEIPEGLYVLLKGAVEVEKITFSGNRQVVNRFTKSGVVFGEVYVFLNGRPYDFGCVAREESEILFIPKAVFDIEKGDVAQQLVENMLAILSNKALFLNQKMLIHSAGSIRKKIAMHLLQKNPSGGEMHLMNREELAQYLAVPRPSLSRELMKMQREGYIQLEGRTLSFDPETLEEILF
ncbi:MAG: Crp/Fnr family transcriptional regulator [Peptoniphilus sp.]|nr:Crp/Fnr family transcriptional regulator [Peptoniphilus sp.]MDD7363767.1 Crp/Fnr family transcriptional regulator [Bacillota bacterium]MDY6044608.1 Crp/Fnr family transcriptional regulator [Peptoniphilus sp.]